MTAAAAGGFHSLALKSDGTVVAWGANNAGQGTVPEGLSGVTAIAAGDHHNVALKSDGTVVAWGANSTGQATVPEGLSGVTAVAAGWGHSLALKSDGTVVAWGANFFGEATVPEGLNEVTAIAAGGEHNLALKSDGTVVAWGAHYDGLATVPEGLSGVTAVAAGWAHNLALKSDGTVVAWGRDDFATVPEGLSGVTAIAAGVGHSLALKSDGTVVEWVGIYPLTLPEGLRDVTAIAAGGSHSLAIRQLSAPPIASAGSDQTVHGTWTLVTLDGSGSSDPQGLVPLAYAWRFASKPKGSTAMLSNATSVNATFTADVFGDYVLSLTVTNSAGVASAPDTVLVSTTNSAPLADAGPDQAITQLGATVILDGSQSYDPDGDPYKYQWAFASKPSESKTQLVDADTASPSFRVDAYGEYVVQLIVNDLWVAGAADTVTISFENLAPVANAGTSSSVHVGSAVTLDGSASSDPNGDPLAYAWAITAAPVGSTCAVNEPAAANTTFVPDREGTYVVQLIVNDGLLKSAPSSIQIEAIMTASAAVDEVMDVQESVATVPTVALKNTTMTNALNNKLNSVIQMIQAGDYAAALSQLEHDVLPKTDGCATSIPPAPDKNDWITSCSEQGIVYEQLLQLIADLTSLL